MFCLKRSTFGLPLLVTLCALGGRLGHAAPDPLAAAGEDLRTGRYERARQRAARLARSGPYAARAAVLAARAEQRLGLLSQARRRLEEATVRTPRDLPLRAELMRVVDALGDRATLKRLADLSHEEWDAGEVDRTRAPELVAMAVALRYDNNWDDANELLRRAIKADPRFTEANIVWGEVFLEKHAAAQAETSFKEVLAQDPRNPDARVGMARVLLDHGYDGSAAEKEIAAARAIDPRHAGALALQGEIALDAEELDRVAEVVAEIRRTNPQDAGAAWLAAARALLLDDLAGYEKEKRSRLGTRPADGLFFARTAEALVRHRRYDDARRVAAEGVALDEKSAPCLASLGLTLLRLGEESEGLDVLRRAWERDPYDTRTYNLLNLFEKIIPGYLTVKTAHLTFRIEPAARAAVEAVVAPFLEEVYARYARRYGLKPKGPVVFELYGDPTHYAVRTVGLPRLGVAAVCFGRVITSQSPTNGAFNWGLVLAHELAHVFALELSRSRVPRWFTEGLSELETAALRPEWRRRGEVALAAGLASETLVSLERLSQAFIRARDVEAANLAYLQAAMAVEFLERRFGFGALREALVAFGRGERVPAVLGKLSGMSGTALEQAFRGDLTERLAGYRDQFLPAHAARLAANDRPDPRRPASLSAAGLRALYAGDAASARALLARALALPAGRDDPTVGFLAGELALAAGEAGTAAEELGALPSRGRDGYDVRLRLAAAAAAEDRRPLAEEHLRRAIALAPTEVEPRMMLAQLLAAGGRVRDRLNEEAAILRLEPQTATLAKRVVLEHARAGRTDAVTELAPLALFIDPADSDLHASLGRALAAQRKSREALHAFELALLFSPSDPGAIHRAMADLWERLGQPARAAEHRRRAPVSAPSARPTPREDPRPTPPRAAPPGH